MANEKKMGAAQVEEEKVPTAVEATEGQTEGVMDDVPVVKEGADVLTQFVLERKTFLLHKGEPDEKECFDYRISFDFPTTNGFVPTMIHFIPSNVAGFEVLDLIYSFPDAKAEFLLRPWFIKADKKRGIEESSGYSYIVRCSALPEFELKVRPAQDSDRALAKALLALSGYKA